MVRYFHFAVRDFLKTNINVEICFKLEWSKGLFVDITWNNNRISEGPDPIASKNIH